MPLEDLRLSDKDMIGTANTEKFNKVGFPTTKNEEWKYTSVKDIVSLSYKIANEAWVDSARMKSMLREEGSPCNLLVMVQGVFRPDLSVILDEELQITNTPEESLKHSYGWYNKYNNDGFIVLNETYSQYKIHLSLKKGAQLKHAIYIHHYAVCEDSHVISVPHITVECGAQSEAVLCEVYHKVGENTSLHVGITEMVLNENSHLTYYKILDEGLDSNHIGTTQVNQLGKSTFRSGTYVLSGQVVRNNLNITLMKPHAECFLHGLNFIKGNTHVDHHTVVDHAVPNCESNQLYKGVLDEQSTSIFNGKIYVRADAQKTNAYQSSKNILLSPDATSNSKPQLEIWADDVKCSHGHATGQMDKDQLFYLKARGIGDQTARKMLTQAFAQDVLKTIHLDSLRAEMERRIQKQ